MDIDTLKTYLGKFCKTLDWQEEHVSHTSIWWSYTFLQTTKLKTLLVGLAILGVKVDICRACSIKTKPRANCEIDIFITPTGYAVDVFLGYKSIYWKTLDSGGN